MPPKFYFIAVNPVLIKESSNTSSNLPQIWLGLQDGHLKKAKCFQCGWRRYQCWLRPWYGQADDSDTIPGGAVFLTTSGWLHQLDGLLFLDNNICCDLQRPKSGLCVCRWNSVTLKVRQTCVPQLPKALMAETNTMKEKKNTPKNAHKKKNTHQNAPQNIRF